MEALLSSDLRATHNSLLTLKAAYWSSTWQITLVCSRRRWTFPCNCISVTKDTLYCILVSISFVLCRGPDKYPENIFSFVGNLASQLDIPWLIRCKMVSRLSHTWASLNKKIFQVPGVKVPNNGSHTTIGLNQESITENVLKRFMQSDMGIARSDLTDPCQYTTWIASTLISWIGTPSLWYFWRQKLPIRSVVYWSCEESIRESTIN